MRFPDGYIGDPVRSLQTMLAVIARADREIPAVLPDGLYGEGTAEAIRAVQQKHGLPQTGQTDQATWNQVADRFSQLRHFVLPAEPLRLLWQPLSAIRPGEQAINLYLIQSMLAGLGEVLENVPHLTVTGVHDESSVAAVRWLQEQSDLPTDGVITQVEWRHLSKLFTALTPLF